MQVAFVFAGVALLAALGVGLRSRGVVQASLAPRLSSVAINVTLPLGIFATLHTFDLGWRSLGPGALASLLTLASWALGEWVGRWLKLEAAARASFVLAVTFSNTAFLGFPICRAVWGEPGFAEAVLIDQVGMEPLSVVVGMLVATRGATGVAKVDWAKELKGLATFPPLVALALGIGWKWLGFGPLPAWLVTGMDAVAALTVPLVAFALGLSLRKGKALEFRKAVGVAAVLRLAVLPAVTWGAASLVGLPPLPADVLVLEMAMPTMMFTLVLALRTGLDAELAAAFVGVSTVLSAVTLPVWIVLLG